MKELTKAEEQIMHILWDMKKGFVTEILEKFPEPRPAYNTVSTIVRILEKKGFVNYVSLGKSHQYYPLVNKKDYTRSFMRRFVKSYFGSSYKEMVSFFTREENLSVEEMDEIGKLIQERIKDNEEKK